MERQIKIEEEKLEEATDLGFILNLETQLNAAMASQNARTTEHMKLQEKKDAKFKDLKATREQRVKRLEDSKETFIGWVRNLMSDPETRYDMGIEMEKMRPAAYEEEKRLSEYHEYEDHTVDQPFLTPENAKDD